MSAGVHRRTAPGSWSRAQQWVLVAVFVVAVVLLVARLVMLTT